jgi:hypothetical protein
MSRTLRALRNLAFSVIAVVVVVRLFGDSSPQWTAFVYPDIKNIPSPDQAENFVIGEFESFEDCQAAAITRVRNINGTADLVGDYQCGFKCSHRSDFGGVLICKETRK